MLCTTGEDVQVARCLSERALLEPLTCRISRDSDRPNSQSSAILGTFLPSCIAAACVFLSRAHMLALRHQLPLRDYLDERNVANKGDEKATEEVWTAVLTRFSGV